MATKAYYPQTKTELAPKTDENKALEKTKIHDSIDHINQAIQNLVDAPQMDFMGDKQHCIKELEYLLTHLKQLA